jgi:hypothetical protein
MRLLGMGVLAALSASAVLAGAASAGEYNLKNLPEIGRCQKVGGRGEFRGSKCNRAEPGRKYSWFSGPGSKPKFTGTVSQPIELTLRNNSSGITGCSSGEVAGEYTGPKNLKITKLLLKGCHGSAGACVNSVGGTAGEVTFEELVGELGFIQRTKKVRLGWDLRPASGSNLAKYECGGMQVEGKVVTPGASREVQGSVIATIEPAGKMTSEFVLVMKEKSGGQSPERFEKGVTDTLTTILGEKLPGTGKTPFATVFVAKLHLKGEEALEAQGRCAGTGC